MMQSDDSSVRHRLTSFYAELAELSTSLGETTDESDVDHLKKIELWGRLATLIGYATCWIGINPVAMVGIALGASTRWLPVSHQILHRGYDKFSTMPDSKKSAHFARGWTRFVSWLDCIKRDYWMHEHNLLHHFRLGERTDPDVPENVFSFVSGKPVPVRIFYTIVGLASWKITYFSVSNVVNSLKSSRSEVIPFDFWSKAVWDLRTKTARTLWFQCWLPYLSVRFILFPGVFALVSWKAAAFALINSLGAEVLTNFHTFVTVVSNHSGSDVPNFSEPAKTKNERLLRQIVGSVNYRTGGDLNDFLQGWLNYQIEHHVWPDLSLREYQRVQPRLRALCEKHGVPYVQESISVRAKKMLLNVIGFAKMPTFPDAETYVAHYQNARQDRTDDLKVAV